MNNKNIKIDFMLCIEIVLMRSGNANYNQVIAKLDSAHNCTLVDCFEHPEYLREVLKEVYKNDYNLILENIKDELDCLANMEKEKSDFLTIMNQ